MPKIVEYKRGKPKKDDRDIVQLVAQTMCLEETLHCKIDKGYLYYHSVNKKVAIEISEELRQRVTQLSSEMHDLYQQATIPKAEYFKNCQLCSLVDICLPRLSKKSRSVSNYIQQAIINEEDV